MRNLSEQRIGMSGCIVRKPEQPIDSGIQVRVVDQVQFPLPAVISSLATLISHRCDPVVPDLVLSIQRIAVSGGRVLVSCEPVQGHWSPANGQTGSRVERLYSGRVRRPTGELMRVAGGRVQD